MTDRNRVPFFSRFVGVPLALAITTTIAPALAQEGISASAAAQIGALSREKASRTPAQKKLDSHILYSARIVRGLPLAPGVPSLPLVQDALELSNGLVHVEIRASVTPDVLSAIGSLGGRVEASFGQYNTIDAWLPLASAETLAGRSDVNFIRPVSRPASNLTRTSAGTLSTLAPRLHPHAICDNPPCPMDGPRAHGADIVQANGITGVGVKIGAMSGGVASLASEQAAGHLPAVTVLAGQAGGNDDGGTGLLEIIHSFAPGAQLFYATVPGTDAGWAANILALRNAGCDIIVSDPTALLQPVFQDGPVAQAVNTITASGALYFTAGGNAGNLDSNTSGTWEGDFVAGANFATDPNNTGVAHNFGPNSYDVLTATSGLYSLQWSDPFGASCNDYDFYILNSTGTGILGFSNNNQSCQPGQDPLEIIFDQFGVIVPNSRVVIVNYLGMAQVRALHLHTFNGGRLSVATDGAVYSHAGAASALAVEMVSTFTSGGHIFTGGTANPPKIFDNDGPRKMFYDANGSPITPGNLLFGTNGGTTIPKIDFLAADDVYTPIFGDTSGSYASAASAGGIAALIKSAKPSLTGAQIRNAMISTALPVSNFNSRTVGAGIVMANLAVAFVTNTVSITINSTPSGLSFTSSGAGCQPGSYVTPIVLNWTPGSSCMVGFTSPQNGPVGTRYVFTTWTDGGITANPRTITAPASATAYTATFKTQYQLTTVASPAGEGTITGAGFYDVGTVVPVTATANSGYQFVSWTGPVNSVNASTTVTMMSAPVTVTANFTTLITTSSSLVFIPITPCRVVDTRIGQNFAMPFGAPSLVGGGPSRTFPIPASTRCSIPANAAAYSFNVTVIPTGPLGFLVLWPTGQPRPNAVTVDDVQGEILNNAAIVPAGANGAVDVFASHNTDLVIDINGYYVPAPAAGSLVFVPMTPCRVVDTRNSPGPFGGPILMGGGNTTTGGPMRTFTIPASPTCSIPANAMAYSFNVTVIPPGLLGFLTMWPTGQPRPIAVTVDDVQGQILNNAAIVPAGMNGAVDVFASQDTHLVIDINGYFVPAASPPAAATAPSLVFVAMTPCRVADTRASQNFPSPFGAPSLVGGGYTTSGGPMRTFPIRSSTNCSIPANAMAYSFNVTVIPPVPPLGFLVLWPTGQPRPVAVTLDDVLGLIVNNLAIVPAGMNGSVDVFASQDTDLVIDINGYFIPAP